MRHIEIWVVNGRRIRGDREREREGIMESMSGSRERGEWFHSESV